MMLSRKDGRVGYVIFNNPSATTDHLSPPAGEVGFARRARAIRVEGPLHGSDVSRAPLTPTSPRKRGEGISREDGRRLKSKMTMSAQLQINHGRVARRDHS